MLASDTIKITNFHVKTIVGIHTWEQERPQLLIMDLVLGICFDPVFFSGKLEDTLDYTDVAREIDLLCQNNTFKLLEELACVLLKRVVTRWSCICDVQLSIRKPCALSNAVASIECYRTREAILKWM